MKGIYKFTNKINGKCYIGQSVSLENRRKSHKRNYKNKNLPSYESNFYKALRKYGFDNFDYEIICQSDNFSIEDLNYYEQYYVKYYDSYHNGYNMNYGGNATGGNYYIDENTILKIKDILKNNPEISMTQIKEDFNISSVGIISSINSGKSYNFVGNYNYPIRKQDNINQIYQGERNGNAVFSNNEVLDMRKQYVSKTLPEIYNCYKDRASFDEIKKIVYGTHFLNLPIYKKRQKKWYLNGTCIDYPCEKE